MEDHHEMPGGNYLQNSKGKRLYPFSTGKEVFVREFAFRGFRKIGQGHPARIFFMRGQKSIIYKGGDERYECIEYRLLTDA